MKPKILIGFVIAPPPANSGRPDRVLSGINGLHNWCRSSCGVHIRQETFEATKEVLTWSVGLSSKLAQPEAHGDIEVRAVARFWLN